MPDSVSETALGPVEWSDWLDDPSMLVKYRHGVFSQLAPRYYKTSVELDYLTATRNGPEQTRDILLCQRSIALISLVDRVRSDWDAEVPREPLEFGSGAGLSSGASMFFNRPVIELEAEDEE